MLHDALQRLNPAQTVCQLGRRADSNRRLSRSHGAVGDAGERTKSDRHLRWRHGTLGTEMVVFFSYGLFRSRLLS